MDGCASEYCIIFLSAVLHTLKRMDVMRTDGNEQMAYSTHNTKKKEKKRRATFSACYLCWLVPAIPRLYMLFARKLMTFPEANLGQPDLFLCVCVPFAVQNKSISEMYRRADEIAPSQGKL